jgi:hypothetical protein
VAYKDYGQLLLFKLSRKPKRPLGERVERINPTLQVHVKEIEEEGLSERFQSLGLKKESAFTQRLFLRRSQTLLKAKLSLIA